MGCGHDVAEVSRTLTSAISIVADRSTQTPAIHLRVTYPPGRLPDVTEPGWPFGNRPTPRLLWEVWKSGRIMSCEMNEHPIG